MHSRNPSTGKFHFGGMFSRAHAGFQEAGLRHPTGLTKGALNVNLHSIFLEGSCYRQIRAAVGFFSGFTATVVQVDEVALLHVVRNGRNPITESVHGAPFPYGFGASGWRHGVGWQSRRRRIVARWRALLALGCRQMRGGGSLGQTKNDYAPAGSGRWRSSVFAKVKATCSRATSRRAHDILGVLLHCSLIIPGQPQVPRRHATPGTPGGSTPQSGPGTRRTTHGASARWCLETR